MRDAIKEGLDLTLDEEEEALEATRRGRLMVLSRFQARDHETTGARKHTFFDLSDSNNCRLQRTKTRRIATFCANCRQLKRRPTSKLNFSGMLCSEPSRLRNSRKPKTRRTLSNSE